MGCRIDIQGRPDDLPHPVPAPSSPAPPPLPHRLLSWKIDRIVMCLTQDTLDARIDVSAINILTLSAFKDASQAMLKAKYRVSSARRASSSSSASGSSNSNSGMHEVAPPRSRASASARNSRSAVQKVAVQYWRRWFGGAETIGPWHDVNEFAHLLISDPCHNHGKGAFLEFFRSTTSDCEPAPPKPFEFSPHSIGANGVQITPSVSQQLPHTSAEEVKNSAATGGDFATTAATEGAAVDDSEGAAVDDSACDNNEMEIEKSPNAAYFPPAAVKPSEEDDTDEAGVPLASSPPSGRIRNRPVLKQEPTNGPSPRYRMGQRKGISAMKSLADPGKHVVCLHPASRVRSGCASHSLCTLQSHLQYSHTFPLCAGLCCSQGHHRRWPTPVRWRGAFIPPL
jgi:hypothetical protein